VGIDTVEFGLLKYEFHGVEKSIEVIGELGSDTWAEPAGAARWI